LEVHEFTGVKPEEYLSSLGVVLWWHQLSDQRCPANCQASGICQNVVEKWMWHNTSSWPL